MNIKDYRQKIYYPESQIVKNLFTNGREFMLLRDFTNYVGFYHRYTTGEIFTEHEWNALKSERLIRFRDLSEPKKKYYDLKHFYKSSTNSKIRRKKRNNSDEYYKFTSPRPTKRELTQKEIDAGSTYRYIVTKRNERDRIFFEISPEQSKKYGDTNSGINQYLYEMIAIPWKVDGPEYDIHDGYLLKIPGVIDTNLRIIDRYSKKFRLIKQLFRNPRELTVYENVVKQNVISKINEPITKGETSAGIKSSTNNQNMENSVSRGKENPGGPGALSRAKTFNPASSESRNTGGY